MDDKDAGKGSKESQIEAPDRLVEGQNFYDQFPFTESIALASLSYNIPESELRFTLTHLARAGLSPFFNKVDEENLEARRQRLEELFETRKNIANIIPRHAKKTEVANIANFPNLHHAMRAIVTKLDQHPMWDKYIDDRMRVLSPSEYKVDGTFFTQKNQPEMARSYLSWSDDRTARKARIAELRNSKGLETVEIEKIFAEESTRDPIGDVRPGGNLLKYRARSKKLHM